MKSFSSLPSPLERKFSRVFKINGFQGDKSLSGRGSDLDQTMIIEAEIPKILKEFQIRSVLDVPCGDQNWIKQVNFGDLAYLGADIVPDLIKRNNKLFGSEIKKFITLDLTRSIPPQNDLILCRDLFVHLNTKSIQNCLSNIKDSGSKYLLTTTFTGERLYKNLRRFTRGVAWRPINLEMKPFSFPSPLIILNEGCTEAGGTFSDKSLGLWRISEL